MKIFDWNKAAQIIAERKPAEASAGLREDWFWTAGPIWNAGGPVSDGGAYLASSWATPVLRIPVSDGETIEIECWRQVAAIDVEGADPSETWPASAHAIVAGVSA